ncbi:MAG: hypothetical protein COZ06_36785 [Armatimonadetes bacterium CG_4_10_14_3_um_filter_66_18]|nr:DUF86 domain-containing protein [Armatimonadota bacterium]OIP01320.1 MAG: hypothetical protein AUJ96_17495 [Armatimonadetes bacterium CG2_30_66_41]PIU89132.1 MAG: hypothetical protein COS65_29075 [Armatimonadetes bacterium CG06_land_8_20_14_3_00_66_21]PIW12836.1 MAG: hypothetical protein COW34_12975 [Armatimonadetes bacterium CG17_big_fil_post_rev_8_21_14_2_50_66_6]PIX39373.1 MAG: hypothetical protein COZ57_28370 [Armatimonadetes bacterium CG_4_8_14_3_um_filter_66_20]PIY36156.1 MAG: hypothe
MSQDDRWRLQHILDAAHEAMALAQSQSRDALSTDRKLALSLCHLLTIIGEAARYVSDAERDLHPQVPWRKMVGLRDRVVHRYFDTNLDTLWQIVQEDLPELVSALEDLLPPLDVTEEVAAP